MVEVEQADVDIQAKAILNLAKAESEEEGIQLDKYNAQLDRLRESAKGASKPAQ